MLSRSKILEYGKGFQLQLLYGFRTLNILDNDSLDILVIYFQPVHRKMFHLIIKHFTT
jgi:hypothetical protein